MKFLHCADLHIGACSYIDNHLERSEQVIHDIFSIAKERDIKTVVIAGDIFHEGNTTKEQRYLFQRLLIGYDAAGFNILVIPGNHDLINHSGETALRYLSILYNMGCFKNSVVTENTMYHQIDDTIFLLLVHKPKQFKKDFHEATKFIHNSSITLPFKNFVVVTHELLQGAIGEFKDKQGKDIIIKKGEFIEDSSFITYTALGDIHKMQKMGPRVFYSGSPYQLKFGEAPEKGVLIVDTDNPDNPEFVQIKSKQLIVATSKENISEEHYVKLLTNKLDLNDNNLPDNVVKTEYVKNEIDLAVHIEEGEQLKNNVLNNVNEHLEKKYSKEDLINLKQIASQEVDELFLIVD